MKKICTALICWGATISAWALAAAPQSLDIKAPALLTGTPLDVQPGSKGLVVVFLSAKCPCSDSHIGELKALAKDFPAFHFIAVHSNRDEDAKLSKAYFQKADLPFPVAQDDAAVLANRFKAFKTPHAFVLSPKGEKLFSGGVTDSHEFSEAKRKYLREALEDILNGRPVRTAEARTLGCIIQR